MTKEKLYAVLGEAVADRLTINSSMTGLPYTAEKLWDLNTKTLEDLYAKIPNPTTNGRARNKSNETSLFDKQAELIDTILTWREDESKREELARKARKDAQLRIQSINKHKSKAEEDRLSKLTQEELDAELLAAELALKEQFV